MAGEIINIIQEEYSLTAQEITCLNKTLGQLNREERKIYYQKIKPKVDLYKQFLAEYYQRVNEEKQEELLNSVVESLLLNRGEPDLSDKIALEVWERFEIYKRVREQAQERDLSLRISSTSGGCVAVIVFITIILLILSYIFTK